ncbi:MAG: 50S ribosomal protein L25/general stress protein Ctc [Bifidobacteriaceae bacterium]|jgi:large subunit ribosomal protein L25|nr:50S ribosomal protein L25/general stress protein Ctc [Bifidobacteriaceae bacterium]MCI1978624.1 50S ribosomal protein L25/general stress protein Ctc [Bifidobacteriaceae bacterium]
MAERIVLQGEERTEFGKGAARRLRMKQLVLATVYAGGKEPQFLELPMRETKNALRRSNALYELKFGKEDRLAVVKDIQRNPVKQIIEHIDFYEVTAGEKINVEVPVFIEGETKGNGVAFIDIQQLSVRADVTNLPENFTLSVEGLQEGDKIFAKDIKLPEGVELADVDPDESVVSVQIPQEEVEPEVAAPLTVEVGADAADADAPAADADAK